MESSMERIGVALGLKADNGVTSESHSADTQHTKGFRRKLRITSTRFLIPCAAENAHTAKNDGAVGRCFPFVRRASRRSVWANHPERTDHYHAFANWQRHRNGTVARWSSSGPNSFPGSSGRDLFDEICSAKLQIGVHHPLDDLKPGQGEYAYTTVGDDNTHPERLKWNPFRTPAPSI